MGAELREPISKLGSQARGSVHGVGMGVAAADGVGSGAWSECGLRVRRGFRGAASGESVGLGSVPEKLVLERARKPGEGDPQRSNRGCAQVRSLQWREYWGALRIVCVIAERVGEIGGCRDLGPGLGRPYGSQ